MQNTPPLARSGPSTDGRKPGTACVKHRLKTELGGISSVYTTKNLSVALERRPAKRQPVVRTKKARAYLGYLQSAKIVGTLPDTATAINLNLRQHKEDKARPTTCTPHTARGAGRCCVPPKRRQCSPGFRYLQTIPIAQQQSREARTR